LWTMMKCVFIFTRLLVIIDYLKAKQKELIMTAFLALS
jgi:hypothetical protein